MSDRYKDLEEKIDAAHAAWDHSSKTWGDDEVLRIAVMTATGQLAAKAADTAYNAAMGTMFGLLLSQLGGIRSELHALNTTLKRGDS